MRINPALATTAELSIDQIGDGSPVSEAVYWEQYYEMPDHNYEWNNGILEEKPMPDYQNVVLYRWFLALLEAFLYSQPVAKLVNLEMGFRLKLPHKTTIRKPDLFIVRNDNPVPLLDNDRSFRGICDLAVESISDETRKGIERDTKVKKGEYELVGVHEYYILDALGTHTTFYRRTPKGNYMPIAPTADGVLRSEVLPGFQFRLEDIKRQPTLFQLAEDPVYQEFVLLEYQAAKERAELERALAAQERIRAEEERMRASEAQAQAAAERIRTEEAQAKAAAERTRAERYAAKLRALGIDPDNLDPDSEDQ